MKALDRGQTPTITPDLTDELFVVQVDADGVARDGRASIGTLLEATASSQYRRQEAWQDFRTAADGDLTTLDSGQTWLPAWNTTNSANKPVIASGKLEVANVGAAQGAGGYAQVLLASTVKRIGADVTFSSYSTTNGVLALVIWKDNPIVSGTSLTIPYSPLHLTVGPTAWQMGVWETPTGLASLGSGNFSTALTADDTTVHRIEVEIVGSTAYIYLPDGSVKTITDSRIASYAGRYACWEPFRTAASTDSKARVVQCWASSSQNVMGERPVSQQQLATVVNRLTNRPIVQAALATDGSNISLTGTPQNVPGLSITTARTGATGKVLATANLYVTNSSGLTLFNFVVNGSALGMSAVSGAYTGRVTVSVLAAVGTTDDFTVTVAAWTTGTSTVNMSNASGQLGTLTVTSV